jgi:SNF2 family DNA or RNA helicase
MFQYKTKPWAHQDLLFMASRDMDGCGLLCEQRTGKTKIVLDSAAYAHDAGKIDALLIIAPNGVHRAWVTDAIPEHLVDATNYRCIIWRSSHAHSKAFRAELEEWFKHPSLKVMSVNIDAILTVACQEMLKRLLTKHKVMSIVDESSDISNPGAQRTKVALRIARRSVMRRILDGTPVAQGPLGLYSQFEFLRPGALGFTSYYSFKARYAVLVKRTLASGHTFQEVKGFRNLDELQARMRAMSYRVTRAECHDLPPKVYEKRYITLAPAQRLAYDELRKHAITELAGQVLTAPLVLTRYLRLQQIASNIAVVDATLLACPTCDPEAPDEGCVACHGYGYVAPVAAPLARIVPDAEDPRLLELERIVDGLGDQQGIVWARFKPDLEAISAWCRGRGISYVRYDGSTDAEAREAGKAAFMRGEARLFLGNARAGGRGLDLSAATFVVYFSHDWGLRVRLQSEDRAQSLARTDAVLYLDILAEDTVDCRIVEALRSGRSISDLITGDKISDWI